MDNLRNINFGSGVNRTYNIAALVFLIFSFLCCCTFSIMLILPGPQTEERVLPQQLILPSPTDTLTPTITNTPWPATFTPTFTPTFTSTPAPSATQTSTPTQVVAPTLTITMTGLPTETPPETATPTETLGPSPTSPPPFPFATKEAPQFVANTFNSAGCAWQGIGGQVFDLDGQTAYTRDLVVKVFGGQLPTDLKADTGSNTLFGASGFEIQVANAINTSTYFVQLESKLGTAVTDRVQVTFPGDCSGNVALVNFVLIHSL